MGATLPHLRDIQAPIRMTIEEIDMHDVGASTSQSSDENSEYDSENEKSNEEGDGAFYFSSERHKRSSLSIKAKFGLVAVGFMLVLLMIPLGILLILAFVFTSGSLERPFGLLWTFLSFVILILVLVLPCFIIKKNRNNRNYKMFGIFAMLSLIGYFSVIQVGISIIIPPSSIVANGMGEVFVGFTNFNIFSETGKAIQVELNCNYTVKSSEARKFYGCAFREDQEINLFLGGLPAHFHNARAMTIKNHIFLEQDTCLDTRDIVHEMAHVWQFSKGLWFGPRGPMIFFSWLHEQASNRTGMYNYGGEDGLRAAKAAGKSFLEFNFEQQASIVEDYFQGETQKGWSPEYVALLKEFCRQGSERL